MQARQKTPDRQSRQSNPMSPLRSNAGEILRSRQGDPELASSYAASRVGSQRAPDQVSHAPSRSSKVQAAAFDQQEQ